MSLKIIVDRSLCSGHARCAAKAPDVYDLDSDGYCISDGKIVPEALRPEAQRGARACPERAIKLSDE